MRELHDPSGRQSAQQVGPVVGSVSPSSGPASGGALVTVTGSGFSAVTAVWFGSLPAIRFTVESSSRITAVTPPGAGTVRVSVSTLFGGTSTQNVTYTYLTVAAPRLTAITPDSGPVSGGNVVALTGTGLTGATAVHFGTVPATSFTVVSATRISAVVPPGVVGPVAVTVTTPGGVSDGLAYYYLGAPTLTGVSPAMGPIGGGNTVTLTGDHLSTATAVRFGSVPAPSFTVVSDTRITAVAPPGVGTAQITVETTAGVSNGVRYAYLAAPVLVSVSPDRGPQSGGDSVTIAGTGLTWASAVRFGSASATFTVLSDTRLTAVVPPGSGTAPITVTTPGGVGSGISYTYLSAPAI
ncbi:IPT/TIG domain-containing protein [Streptomyces sp. SAJ15]|uniref:IPT/TIG domain-containing protein n=1 Tax=Streptomyces sp. SAJ15 TaxID=2011095 RepID=UPI0011869B2B|nr:IPT/TIG domain-containing protein [Streptomyces sp. SAJ15]TVL91539.1 cell shape-determining protein [Streptomyces sp. SAJ15]